MESLNLRIFLIAALAVSTLVSCGDDGDSPFPAVALPALPGFAQTSAELDTGDLEGPTVVNFWATWCVPCRTELPEFQRASTEHPNVRFVGIDEGFAPEQSVAFLDELGISYDQFVDTDGVLAEDLEISELPATVVLAGDGSISTRHTGAMSYDELVIALTETER